MSDTAQNKDGVGAILDKFFIMRAGTPDDDLEELKLRNEMGEPEKELATQIEDFYRSKILEAKVNLLEHLMTSNPQYTYEAAKDILIDLKSTKDAITAQSQPTKQESR